jgi:uncharacterized protein
MPQQPAQSAVRSVRRHFHLCLAAALLPVITLPLEWAVALEHRRQQATPEHRRWARRLFALVVVDTIIAGCVIALFASGVWSWQALTKPSPPAADLDPVRIGAIIVAAPQRPDEALITAVANNSPAQRAGLKAGDVLIAIDGVPVRDFGDAITKMQAGAAGVPRTLRIRRAGQDAEIVVTPERRGALGGPISVAATTAPCSADFRSYQGLRRWRGLWVGAALAIVLWLVARRVHGRAPALWSWVLAAFAIDVIMAMAASWAMCVSLGGRTPEGTLVAQLIGSFALLSVGLVAMRRMARAGLLGARVEPLLTIRRAVVRGFFYLIVIKVRASILVAAIDAVVPDLPVPPEENVLAGLATLGALGKVLLVFGVAVVVPVAEEILFRGVVLPRLVPWMGPGWAVVASSAVFAVLHEGAYGVLGVHSFPIFLIALALGWARLRTGGLAAPIIMHMVANAIALSVTR